jgi:hypothetical protein
MSSEIIIHVLVLGTNFWYTGGSSSPKEQTTKITKKPVVMQRSERYLPVFLVKL